MRLSFSDKGVVQTPVHAKTEGLEKRLDKSLLLKVYNDMDPHIHLRRRIAASRIPFPAKMGNILREVLCHI